MNDVENLQMFIHDCSNISKLRPSEVIQFISGKFKNYLQLRDLLSLNKSKEISDYEIGWYDAIESMVKILDMYVDETVKAESNNSGEQNTYRISRH